MSTLAPGDAIGGYEVLAEPSRGATAAVYPVRDLRTGEHHALKRLNPGQDARPFDHEYEVMSHLNEAGVLRTYRYGVHDALPWFSMELLRGLPSHSRVKQLGRAGEPARTTECLAIAAFAARSLEYIHRRGVVHREIKPANVVVLPDRRLRIVDFADAVFIGRRNPVPEAAGAYGFSAPEVLTGAGAEPRSDLYSLGATLYRLITGKTPFKAANHQATLQRQQAGDFQPLDQLVDRLPRQLVEMVHAMLHPDPAGRPGSATAVAERLGLLVGQTLLTGASLAIYDKPYDAPADIALAVVTPLAGFTVIYGDDHRYVRQIVECVVSETSARREPLVIGGLDGEPRAGIARAITEISKGKIPLKHATRLPWPKLAGYLARLSARRPLSLVFETTPRDVDAQRTAVQAFSGACAAAGANVRVLLLDEQQGPDLMGAQHIRLPRWSVDDTAIAVGRMVGRRPPTGELAHEVFKATGGYRTAVEDVVTDLVRSDQVRTEGNQVLWARTHVKLTSSQALSAELHERLSACSKQQLLVLQAVARAGAMSAEVLGKVLPNPEAVAASIEALITMGLLVRTDGRVEPSSPPLSRAILEARGGFPPQVLERMLLMAAKDLPDTPFKVKGLLKKKEFHLAVAAANREGLRLIREGHWLGAEDMVRPLWNSVGTNTGGSDGLSQAYVILAQAGIATAEKDDTPTKAAEAALNMAGSTPQAIRCELVLADLERAKGHYRSFHKHLQLAYELAHKQTKDPVLQAHTAYAVANGHLISGEMRQAAKMLEEIDASEASRGLQIQVLAALALCDTAQGRLADGVATARHALTIDSQNREARADAVNALGNALRRAGQYSEALAVLAEGAQATRFDVDPRPYLKLVLTTGWCEVDLHRLGPAQECVDELQAALHPAELLHSRLEAQLLEARVRLLSGDRRGAFQVLDNAIENAKSAGLNHLRRRAQADLFRAREPDQLDQRALHKWFESERIGFMASKDLWTFVRAFRVMAECGKPVPDPEVAFASLAKAIANETPPQVAIALHIARARHAEATGARGQLVKHLQAAAKEMGGLAEQLEEGEKGALRVHPWAQRIRDALGRASGGRRSTSA